MARYFLTEDGKVDRDKPVAELAVVEDLEPQLLRFTYGGVERIVQMISLRMSSLEITPNLVTAYELYNSRDGLHESAQFKSFSLDKIRGLQVAYS